jgi:ribosome modulation factor
MRPMSRKLAYQHGYAAGRLRKSRGECPYEGHCDASMTLQLQWMAGHFDAVTGKRLVTHRRSHLTRRKTVRIRWPRRDYSRKRLAEILGGISHDR